MRIDDVEWLDRVEHSPEEVEDDFVSAPFYQAREGWSLPSLGTN
jgi:hypothetical protein